MKLKYPKSIVVGDYRFKIIYDKDRSGGSFDYEKKEIVIGVKHGELRALGIIIHELKELINVEQGIRYTNSHNTEDYLFIYTHKEHSDMCARLTGLLMEFI